MSSLTQCPQESTMTRHSTMIDEQFHVDIRTHDLNISQPAKQEYGYRMAKKAEKSHIAMIPIQQGHRP